MLLLGKLVKATTASSFLPVNDLFDNEEPAPEPEGPDMSSFLRDKLGTDVPHLAKKTPVITTVTELDIRARIAELAEDDTGTLHTPIEPTAIMKVRDGQASKYVDVWIEFAEMFGSSDETDILYAIEQKQDEVLKSKFRSVTIRQLSGDQSLGPAGDGSEETNPGEDLRRQNYRSETLSQYAGCDSYKRDFLEVEQRAQH